MRTVFWLFWAGSLCVMGTAAAAEMTLNDAITRALVTDPTVRKIHADVSAAEGFSRSARADLLPQVVAEGSIGVGSQEREFYDGEALANRRISIVARQHLWDGGFTLNRWRDAKQRVEAGKLLDKAQLESTALGTVEAYLDVIRARQQVSYAKQSVAAHETVLGLSKKRAEAAGNQADIELSRARFELARTQVFERELSLRQAEAAFERWVGQKPPANLAVPRVPKIGSLSEIEPTQNFHYLATLRQRDAAELERKALRAKYGPRLFLEAGVGRGENVLGSPGRDNNASLLLMGSWEIFDGGRRRGEIEQAVADINRQTAIIEETLILLNQDINSRWADYRTMAQRLNILHEYAGALGKTVNLYQEQFDLGSRPLLSLLDIQNEVISASIRVADSERDQALLGYRLLFFGGRLIRETAGPDYLEARSGQSKATRGRRSP